MDKKIKTLVILVLTLTGLCICLACFSLWFQDDGNDTTDEPETEAPEAVAVLQIDPKHMEALSFTYDKDNDGEAEVWAYTCKEYKTWQWDEKPDIPLSADTFSALCSSISYITTDHVIEQVSQEDFKKYGLDEPSKTVHIKDNLYGEQTVYFGAFNTYNQMYYVSVGTDTSTVYMVSYEIYDLFEYPIASFVAYNDLPGELTEEEIISLTYEKGDTVISITPKSVEVETGDITLQTTYTWELVRNGEVVTLSDATLLQSLASQIKLMKYVGCLTVDTANDKDYGLDKDTATLTFCYLDDTDEEQSLVLTLGGKAYNDYYYVRPQNTTFVMLLNGASFAQVFESETSGS